jgi:hypothetical protein
MIKPSLSRRLLQVATGFSAVQALIGGALYLWLGLSAIEMVTGVALEVDTADSSWARVDYMLRALAGIWFVLGLMIAALPPRIELHSLAFAFCFTAILAMGVGRMLSGIEYGPNAHNSRAAMVAELLLPPILVLWQRGVARAHARSAQQSR